MHQRSLYIEGSALTLSADHEAIGRYYCMWNSAQAPSKLQFSTCIPGWRDFGLEVGPSEAMGAEGDHECLEDVQSTNTS